MPSSERLTQVPLKRVRSSRARCQLSDVREYERPFNYDAQMKMMTTTTTTTATAMVENYGGAGSFGRQQFREKTSNTCRFHTCGGRTSPATPLYLPPFSTIALAVAVAVMIFICAS
jgi:hypothetical protein